MDLVVVGPLVLLVLALVIAARSVVVVPQGGAHVVERLGRYQRTMGAGVHVLMPFVDRIVKRYSTSEQDLTLGPLPCVSRDNLTCTVDGTVRIAVENASQATYAVADVMDACTQLAHTVLREEIGLLSMDDARESARQLAARVVGRVGLAAAQWGLRVTGCDVSVRRG